MSKRFYITTAIDYLNGLPHLGHAYEKVITDVIARGQRSMGREVFFLTGLDEHGQKVQQAALAEGKDPQSYCDELAQSWKLLVTKLGLSNDDFIRTTEPRHHTVVQAILTKLNQHGHCYKATYEGFYSAKEETFLTEKDRLPDGTFDPIYGEVVRLKEDNYYLRLKDHQQWLIDYIEGKDIDAQDKEARWRRENFIQPSYRRNEVLGLLRNNTLEDLCISRPVSRLNWGIPIPFDPGFVTYVWFDALVNYVTVPASHSDPLVSNVLQAKAQGAEAGLELWPANYHVIGKDILKFHAVYWPILLKAIGLPLPEFILVHGWWQKDGQKMSKSTGNVVDPIAVIDDWGSDAFRYYVVRELDIGPDGNWTDAGFQSRYHAELANGLGNLVNRSLSMLKRYRDGVVPKRHDELAVDANKTIRIVELCFQSKPPAHNLQGALQTIWLLINRANQYVDQTAPFKLAKDPAQAVRLDEVLYNLAEVCRVLAVLLWPFLPTTAEKIYAHLGLSAVPDKFNLAAWGGLPGGHTIGPVSPLFPRRDQA
jgi:methionyl-tRNA synthetase